ncbi:uncharacterized protein EMPS_08496 [Entomortierella parvispora]|uniref:Dienelactone hydrolase domain-containing protein n=1 Tax=Entomortierella parvispora TaxID=205924 RepID=A0A9P3HGD0_9FUNG|nr:uncharacterized protein EMPS_08496 [Entomortierella parvispora]
MTRTAITFPSQNFNIAGHLYIPDSYKGGQKVPAVIVLHPYGGVKEQTAGTYAQELSKNGFVTLAFDRRYQGESEGTPRQVEDAFGAGEDIRSAVTFLSLQDQVDPARIGILGVCAGGGYVIFGASTDRRIKAVAGVSAVDLGAFIRTLGKPTLDGILDQAGQARIDYAKTGEVKYLPIVPELKDVTPQTPNLMAEGAEYYLTPRGGHPNSINRTAIWSYNQLAIYDSYAQIDQISPRPMLLIAGSKADTLCWSEKAMKEAGPENKELYIIEGSTHIDLYDRHVSKVLPKLVEFFKQKL